MDARHEGLVNNIRAIVEAFPRGKRMRMRRADAANTFPGTVVGYRTLDSSTTVAVRFDDDTNKVTYVLASELRPA